MISPNIREIDKSDLTDDFFKLLSQLSGEASEYNSDKLWDAYKMMKPGIVTLVYEKERGLEESTTDAIEETHIKIEGTATIWIEKKFLHCGSSIGHIEDLVVDKASRTKGLGKLLIDECLQIAKHNGCYKVILDCEKDIIPFYVKCGFIPDGYCMRVEVEE